MHGKLGKAPVLSLGMRTPKKLNNYVMLRNATDVQ